MVSFRESQSLRQPLSLLMVTPIFFVSTWGVYRFGLSIHSEEQAIPGLFVISVAGFLLASLYALVTMNTRIDEMGVTITFFPFFIRKKILWSKVKHVDVRRYDWHYESGGSNGVGIRVGRNGLIGYFLTGDMGVWIETEDSRRFIIGTLKPRSIMELIRELKERRIVSER